jgi:shikimate kinase
MTEPRHIFLIGLRGSGKSTVGATVAAALGRPFFDADAELETHYHTTIAEIFRTHGEEAFRNYESETLIRLCDGPPAVIATGGGAILRPQNVERMQRTGEIYWLEVSPDVAFGRIQADATTASRRPNLLHGGLAELAQLLEQRRPAYRTAAHMSVNADAPAGEVANIIVNAVRGIN